MVKPKMSLLGVTCTVHKIVQNVEVALSCRDIGDPAPLQTVVQELAADKEGMGCGGGIVLKLVEQAGFGGAWGSSSLGRRERVEDIRGKGSLVGEGC